MKPPTHISYVLKKSFYLRSWKSLSCIKLQNWKYSQMKFKYFQHPLSFKQMEEVMSSSLQGFVVKIIWIHGDHKSKNESLGKSFYSLSFNFQKVSNSLTQSHNNQTINQIYLFSIAFQNLEFWDVTNLPPLKWISSSRFGEASKK